MLLTLLSALRTLRLRACGAQIGAGCTFGVGVSVRRGVRDGASGTITIGPQCQLDQGVVLDGHGGSIRLAHHVFLGPYVTIYGHGTVEIGEHSLIAMHCKIVSSNHAIPPFGTPIRSRSDELRPTKIGRDVWLGAGVTVLGGVTIGDGCVVGAGAVVTNDLPAGAIAYGVPAAIKASRDGAPL